MKALVTGATGFIGQRLCARLREQDVPFLAFSQRGMPLPGGEATLPLDLHSNSIPVAQLGQADTVFHLAGIAHRHGGGLPYERVNHHATVELARCAESAGVKHLIFLSSVKAMGESGLLLSRSEEDVYLPTDPYGLSKWRAEEALRQQFSNSSMTVSILRPSLVYGHNPRGNLRLLERLSRYGLPRPPEIGARSMVSREDLVEMMLLAAHNAHRGVRTWIATDGEQYSTRRIYDAMRRLQGSAPGRAWMPELAWRLGARMADVKKRGGECTWQKLFGTELYSSALARSELGWQPVWNLETTFGVDAQ